MKPLEPGDVVLGRYRVAHSLGAGGMGVVYLAERIADGKKVVIKTVHDHLATDPQMRTRFLREAQATQSLRHANVVHVIEASADPLLLVLEYVPGRSLHERLRNGPLPEKDVIAIAVQLLDALGAAHKAKLIHRDLKPGNVMVLEGSRVKLLDFGISRVVDEARHTKLTQTGQILGTPGYLAPEQALARAVDARTDLYSLGVLMYRALTGRLPFEGRAASLLRAVVEDDPHPLPALKPNVDPALASVIHRSLQKDPAYRFQTARQMREALVGPRKSRWMIIAAVAGVATAALTVGLLALLEPEPTPPPPPLALQAITPVESQESRAETQPESELVAETLSETATEPETETESETESETETETEAEADETETDTPARMQSQVLQTGALRVDFGRHRRELARWWPQVEAGVRDCFLRGNQRRARVSVNFGPSGRPIRPNVRGASHVNPCLEGAIASGAHFDARNVRGADLILSWSPLRVERQESRERRGSRRGSFDVTFPLEHRSALRRWWRGHERALVDCFEGMTSRNERTWSVTFNHTGRVIALAAGGAPFGVTTCSLRAVGRTHAPAALFNVEETFRVRWNPPE